jgi:anti-anti-sigma factor
VSKPPLTVTVRQAARLCVVSVSGELDIATAPVLAAQAVLPGGIKQLIVDLSGLEFIDCCGARALAEVTGAAPVGCPVVVRGATRHVGKILDMLALLSQQRVQAAWEHAEWLALESQVQRSWAQQARATARKLVGMSRAAREDDAWPDRPPVRARLAASRPRPTRDDYGHGW